jgi:O-antigen/teichoic acid export membrane protein
LNKIFKKYSILIFENRYVLFINITDKVFTFIIFLLLAKNFAYENYGEVVTIFTIATIISTIFDFGLPVYLHREIAISQQNSSIIFSNIFLLYLFILVLYAGINFSVFLIFYSKTPFLFFLIICSSIYLSSLANVCNRALAGKLDFRNQFISFGISRLFILIFFLSGLYVFDFDLNSLLITILIGFFLHLILLFWFLDNNNINLKFSSFNLKYIKIVIKTSIPLGAAIIINFLYDKVDVVIISKLLDYSKVALYNVGYGIYKTSSLAFTFLLVGGFTRISFLSRNRKGIYLFLKKYSFLIGIISIITGILLILFSKQIIHIFYSYKYNDSTIILKILSLGTLALGLNNLTGIILNGIGLFKAVMYITLFGLIINIILNILFIPAYGILASSVITVITEYIIFLLEFYYLYKILRVKPTISRK